VRVAQGWSYRSVAEWARTHAGYTRRRGSFRLASVDGRVAGDWVEQYAPILAERYLPTRWAKGPLVLDQLPIHVRDFTTAKPRQSGRISFFVFGAVAYPGGRAHVWRTEAFEQDSRHEWEEFLRGLPGRPAYVVCDRKASMRNAIEAVWPGIRIYPCVEHLRMNLIERLHKTGLYDRRRSLVKLAEAKLNPFNDIGSYLILRTMLDRYLAADWSRMTKKQRDERDRLAKWLDGVEPDIARSLVERHWPVSAGAIERPLRELKNSLYDRRYALRNLDRLNCLLVLYQLHQMGRCNERDWAAALRHDHIKRGGRPPTRRQLDNPALAPR
jgi:hypothetical protein